MCSFLLHTGTPRKTIFAKSRRECKKVNPISISIFSNFMFLFFIDKINGFLKVKATQEIWSFQKEIESFFQVLLTL